MPTVLFVCEGNRARSQIAEALLRFHSCGRFQAYSAGIRPGTELPETAKVLRESSVDPAGLRSKHYSEFAGEEFDHLIVLCDRVRAEAPGLPAARERLDWPVEDPADAQARGLSLEEALWESRRELRSRIVKFMAEALHCIFCGVVAGSDTASMLHEDDLVAAFMDIRPINEGHALVVPLAHYETMDSVPEPVAGRMMEVGRRIAAALRNTDVRMEGYNLFVANGEPAGQEVLHVHLHVIPRFIGDGFGFRFRPGYGQLANRAQLDELARRIGEHLTAES